MIALTEANDQNLTKTLHTDRNCQHCGQILVSFRDLQTGYCCAGCQAAAQFISSLGLENFYCLREEGPSWASKPAIEVSSSYQHFDDPAFTRRYVKHQCDNLSHVQFHLRGIHCAACVWVLEKLPEVISGIRWLRVNVVTGKVNLIFEPTTIKLSKVAHTIAALGYLPTPIAIGDIGAEVPADRTLSLQLGVAAFCAMNVMLLFVGRYQGLFSGIEEQFNSFFAWASLVLSTPAVLYSAVPFYRASWQAIRFGRLHIDLPISIAIVGGFSASFINVVLGRQEIYFDTVTALVFLLLGGRWCQQQALRKVRNASDLLYSLAPMQALKLDSNGKRREVYVESLQKGDNIIVGTGDRFPCDGTVASGNGHVNLAILTGESLPLPASVGQRVWAGTENIGEPLQVTTEVVGERSRLGQILAEAQTAPAESSRIARFVDRVSVYFVVGVIGLAAITFAYWSGSGFWMAWDRVIALLVVSCPCALGIATPVTLALASSQAGRRGLLLRNPDALEKLSAIRVVMFDKTGTLTEGDLGIAEAWYLNPADHQLVGSYVNTLEQNVRHPLARALLRSFDGAGFGEAKSIVATPGRGVTGLTPFGNSVRVGSLDWILALGAKLSDAGCVFANRSIAAGRTVVAFSEDEEVTGLFSIADLVRPEALESIKALKKMGIKSFILSGDRNEIVSHVGNQLELSRSQVFGGLSPEEKANKLSDLGLAVAMVGDGVNDAAAIARADVGIGISGGAEASLKTADIYLARPDLRLIVDAIVGSKRTLKLIHRHLTISLFYNITASALAISGYINPLAAAVVMPLSSITVIISSLLARPFRNAAISGGCK